MVLCDDFRLPPSGTSEEKDFDLLTHLELEPEQLEKKGKNEDEDEKEVLAEVDIPKYKSTVPSIQEYWLKAVPDQDDYIDVVDRCFASGLD